MSKYFATAIIPNGYFGDVIPVSLELRGNAVIMHHEQGYCRSPLPDVSDIREALWLMRCHPAYRGYFKSIEPIGSL